MDRVDLQYELESILGSRQVYFSPPESIKMSYPAIIYDLNRIDVIHANDKKYGKNRQYTVTLMDYDPDSEFVDKILDLPYCSMKTSYAKDNLKHFIFTLYY